MTETMTPEAVLRHVATELTGLAFLQTDNPEMNRKLMGLVNQLDDARVAIRAHHLNEGAELIGSASEERLDEIAEENLEPRHWDRHHAWLDAANVLKKAAEAGQ